VAPAVASRAIAFSPRWSTDIDNRNRSDDPQWQHLRRLVNAGCMAAVRDMPMLEASENAEQYVAAFAINDHSQLTTRQAMISELGEVFGMHAAS
jgi:hypothetical protein